MSIIRSVSEIDDVTGQSLYWSNKDGWVDKGSATIFTNAEMEKYLWLPIGGEWVTF